jgi:hypothetical protein
MWKSLFILCPIQSVFMLRLQRSFRQYKWEDYGKTKRPFRQYKWEDYGKTKRPFRQYKWEDYGKTKRPFSSQNG